MTGHWVSPDIARFTVGEEATARRRYFDALPHKEKIAAIRRLNATGVSAHTIAQACGVSVEQIRRVLRGVA